MIRGPSYLGLPGIFRPVRGILIWNYADQTFA